MKYFQHHSAGSHQEIFHVIGEVIQSQVTQRAGCFSVLCDDSSDSANLEQMISFIQFVDVDTNMVQTKFMFIANILEKSDSPDAETICSVLLENLDRLHLPQQGLCGLVTDGASTMVGRKNGVAARLKRIIPTLLSVHCICHRLALACADATDELETIDNVHLWLTQLWKLFDYSSKKSALLLKVQTEMRHITLTSGAQSSVAKTLKRAWKTRWLSFDSAVKSAFEDILAILHTLKKLSDKDATSVGLLKKMNTLHFFSALYVLKSVLPIVSALSVAFQRGYLHFSRLGSLVETVKADLDDLVSTNKPVHDLSHDVSNGRLAGHVEFHLTSEAESKMQGLLHRYVDALKRNIDERLSESIPVLEAMTVFDPLLIPQRGSCTFTAHGTQQVKILSGHFHPGDSSVQESILAEWGKLKFDLLEWMKIMPEDIKTRETKPAKEKAVIPTALEWTVQIMVQRRSVYGVVFPFLLGLVLKLMSLPLSNAWPERGFSKMKLLKDRLRSRMSNKTLEALMGITINGPEFHTPECDTLINVCVQTWLAKKKRRKLPVPKSSEMLHSSQVNNHESVTVSSWDMCTQTETVSVQEEVKEALVKLGIQNADDNIMSESESECE